MANNYVASRDGLAHGGNIPDFSPAGVMGNAVSSTAQAITSAAQVKAARDALASQRALDIGLGLLGPDPRIMLAGTSASGVGVGRRVIFRVTPEVSESRNVSYAEVSDIRSAASVIIFEGSPSRTFQLSAKFLARTKDEADEVFTNINLLRSWTVPDSRGISSQEDTTAPEVLRLYGYNEIFRGITCVIASLNVEFPTDVDYVTASNGSDIPIVQSVTISLKEAHTMLDIVGFSIDEFRAGTLIGW